MSSVTGSSSISAVLEGGVGSDLPSTPESVADAVSAEALEQEQLATTTAAATSSTANTTPAPTETRSASEILALVKLRAAERDAWLVDGAPAEKDHLTQELVVFGKQVLPNYLRYRPPAQEYLDQVFPLKAMDWPRITNAPADKIQLTWLGHAGVVFQLNGCTLITDPVFSPKCAPTQWLPGGPQRYREPPCTIHDLCRHAFVDIILISHCHYDHLDYASVCEFHKCSPATTFVVPLGLRAWFHQNVGPSCRVLELDWHEHVDYHYSNYYQPHSSSISISTSSDTSDSELDYDPRKSRQVRTNIHEQQLLQQQQQEQQQHGAKRMSGIRSAIFALRRSSAQKSTSFGSNSYNTGSNNSSGYMSSSGAFGESSETSSIMDDNDQPHTRSTLRIAAVPVRHWANRKGPDRDTTLWCGFSMTTTYTPPHGTKRNQPRTMKALFPGDTAWFDCSDELIGERYGPFDVAALPIGAYAPREYMKRNHINVEEAVRLKDAVRAQHAVPIHWGTFPLTIEPVMEPRETLEAIMNQREDTDSFQPWLIGETKRF